MCCYKQTLHLSHPIVGTNFVRYCVPNNFGRLTKCNAVRIIFDTITTSTNQVSFGTFNTNTPVYKSTNSPLLGNDLKAFTEYCFVFDRVLGGYKAVAVQ